MSRRVVYDSKGRALRFFVGFERSVTQLADRGSEPVDLAALVIVRLASDDG